MTAVIILLSVGRMDGINIVTWKEGGYHLISVSLTISIEIGVINIDFSLFNCRGKYYYYDDSGGCCPRRDVQDRHWNNEGGYF